MEQQASTSKVTVEYFDPHDVYKLIAPGLVPRLPLHNLHWQSHAGPLRSIDTLHVDLVLGGDDVTTPIATPAPPPSASVSRDDGFQTQNVGGRAGSTDTVDTQSLPPKATGSLRRHQIPGLRRTPYLKVLLVRCDDNDSYKSTVRAEVREWVKTYTPPSNSKKASNQEMHDAFEWLIVHVVIPNTVAATQPRSSSTKSDSAIPDKGASSRWRTGATPLMEKLRSDFNGSGKGSVDRIAQIRIGINDVPYDMIPRVVPAVPSGYTETEHDAEAAWNELMSKLKSQILSSFDMRVTQYEEDIKEKDTQRALPGWNFCTFFILKEGLARGFENVGLVEDALVGYDELSVGLDSVLSEQAETGEPESHGGAMLGFTDELRSVAEKAVTGLVGDEEAVDMQSKEAPRDQLDDILISSTKKAYRDMILANKVSVFDFRCYIFSRQITLLLRLGNATSTREELLAKLKEQQESVLHGVAPLAPPPPKQEAPAENLAMLAEVCRRTLQFIPLISSVMRQDIVSAMQGSDIGEGLLAETVDNIASSFAFSVAQQILAQTATKALPIPPSTLIPADGSEPKAWIPEPKTMMHPARSTSLHIRPSSRPPPSPGVFPGPGRRASVSEGEVQNAQFLKTGLEDLAAKRAELYTISRSILEGLGKKRGWSNGWDEAPLIGDKGLVEMEEISLDDDPPKAEGRVVSDPMMAGIDGQLLRTAIDNADDFYRLYEILTDKALRHYTVANHEYAVHANKTDLAVLKVHLKEYRTAASYFRETTPFFSASGWSALELSMLVMYSQCVSELQSREDYISAALKLLIKSCAAEKDRLQEKYSVILKGDKTDIPDLSPVKGVVGELLSSPLPNEVKVPLENFFTSVEVVGAPDYHKQRDSCSLSISLWSLLPDEIVLDGVILRAACTDGGPSKEVDFESKDETTIAPGKNVLTVDCTSVIPGQYIISYLALSASNLLLHFKRDSQTASIDIFRHPEISLFQRTDVLDVQLTATKQISLDKNNSLDLELSTGWNSLKSCELRVKPATGGLRLLTNEASFVGPAREFAKPPEAGIFLLNAIEANTSVVIRFPYSVENDLGDVLARLEVFYTTTSGQAYYLARSLTIPVSLALGVNVQDVFKHQALFSRFNVSTASASPLRLYRSELLSSDLFESDFGVAPSTPVIIFPKQAASLLYKIKRKEGFKVGKRTGKTMYLKLVYTQLQSEIEEVVWKSVKEALDGTALKDFERLVLGHVTGEVKRALQAHDLERVALLGQVSTSFLANVAWEKHFQGIGTVPGSSDLAAPKLAILLQTWQRSHPRIPLPSPSPVSTPSTILIPVEIPSLPIVHTADIRLQAPIPGMIDNAVRMNQMLSAMLHLKWTRVWDTEAKAMDQEFSYEVSAQADVWLLGGRRKGHFVIPANSGVSSTAETEAEIPLVLIPQREGWLPYPSVEIKEVTEEGEGLVGEVDWRNLGETVRVVGGRREVTVSLDASGAGGGPLVLGSEVIRGEGRIVA